MSNYTKSTNFATKDNLPTGDPLKIVKGTEIDTEFNNIATAISTKTDNASAAITGGSITGITDLAIADGGTGASTATAALNNLLPSQTSNANKYLQTDGTNASWDAVSLSTADITGTLPIANGGTGTTSTTFVNLASNVTGTLPVANGGTGVTSSTGTGNVVLSNSPTLVTPALGTPASGVATNLTGLPLSTGITGLGTGVATALAINTPNTGAIVVNGGALGTPSSGVVTNLTGTANININGQVGSSTPNSGNFTTLSASSTVNISGGTVDGVAYLDASKNLTTGSVLSFSGVHLTSNRNKDTTYSGTDYTTYPNGFILQNSATPATGLFNSIYFKNNANMQNVFGVVQNSSGYGDFVWAGYSGSYAEWMRLSSSGLTLTSNPTLSGGTANGVTYLNGSKVLTSGSALTFDGTNLGVGVSASSAGKVYVRTTETGSAYYADNATNSGFIVKFASSLTSIGNDFNAPLAFLQNNAEAMRLTSTGLGIGTSSPAEKLTVNGNIKLGTSGTSWIYGPSTTGRSIYSNSDSTAYIIAYGSAYGGSNDAGLQFTAGTSNTMVFNSAGNLGLGVTPSAWGSGYKAIQLLTSSLYGTTSRDMNLGANVYVDAVGYKYIETSFATNYTQYQGAHSWYTAASGNAGDAISFTQAMSLGSDGNLLIGTTSGSWTGNDARIYSVVSSGWAESLYTTGSAGGASIIRVDNTGAQFINFRYTATGVGSITTNGTTTAYNTSSDYRLKNITGPITTSGAYIDGLNPVEGTWKADGSTFVGLIAHEVQEASRTQVATGTKDGAEMQAMDYSNSELIANLIAEVKSLRQRVAQLETN